MTQGDQNPKQWDPWESNSEESEDAAGWDDPIEVPVLVARPIVTQKMESEQPWPPGVDPTELPSLVWHVPSPMQGYPTAKLVELGNKFRQKGRESIPGWLLRLWDTEAEGILLLGVEMSKMAFITSHPTLLQRLSSVVNEDQASPS